MTHASRVALLLVTSLCLLPQLVHAQVSPSDKAAAEALFDYGLQLMRKGDYAQACVKLEQSQAIDRGIGTMLYLAECYERAGRTASAWALFRQAASEAAAGGQPTRAEQGNQRAKRLEPELSKLIVNVAQPAAAGLQVLLDGAPIANGVWGVPLPIDPGEHQLEAHAARYEPWTSHLQVTPHSAPSVDVPALVASPTAAPLVSVAPAPLAPPAATVAPAGSDASATAAGSGPPPAAPSAHDEHHGNGQRVAGLVIGAVGVVGLGVGTYFGVRAIGKNSDAEKFCHGSRCTDPRGESLTNQAQSAAGLSNGFVIGGAALIVTGVLVYLVAPSSHDEGQAFGLDTDGRSLRVLWGGVL